MAFFEGRTPEIVKQWNSNTWLVMDRGTFYVLKTVLAEDLELYKKLILVKSPYFAKVYDVTVLEDQFVAVLEYVQGETLEQYLKSRGTLEEYTTCSIAYDICQALEQLHYFGIIHRDITPKNIIITGDGTAKVIDFGISRLEKKGATRDTEFLGTAGFAAPEQYGFSQTSPRTDIYAVGVLMNYMLTLKFPNEELASGSLRPIIEQCIHIDEADRYRNVDALKSTLRKYLSNHEEATNTAKRSESDGTEFSLNALPGFRHNIWWHKVVAVLYYISSFMMVLVGVPIGDYGLAGRCFIQL